MSLLRRINSEAKCNDGWYISKFYSVLKNTDLDQKSDLDKICNHVKLQSAVKILHAILVHILFKSSNMKFTKTTKKRQK